MTESITRFNKYLYKLIDIIDSTSNIDKTHIETAKLFYNTQLNTFPTIFLDKLGPILHNNNSIIKNEVEDKIFVVLKKEIAEELDNIDNDIKKNLTTIISELENTWSTYSKEEKKYIFKILRILLNEYLKFITD